MLLLDNDDSLPVEPAEDELTFAIEIGDQGVITIDATLTLHARPLWLKGARIIHDALATGGFPISDGAVHFHARRIMALVRSGALEGQGNLHKPRSSEVRLPPV